MFERLKRALVESYVGAIALGYLLAQAIMHFVGIFPAPVSAWAARKEYGELMARSNAASGLPLQDAWPEMIRFFALLLIWYLLVRWLYFKPLKSDTPEPTSNQERFLPRQA